jgi:hypothetical protein
VADARGWIAEASGDWDGHSPLFLSVHLSVWGISLSDVVEIANSLGPDYVVVRADQYFELIREAQPAQPAPAFDGTASKSYEGSPPELAIDGDPRTAWNAGEYAPQWIEVDLGSPRSIEGISLLTAQSPKGETTHRVLAKAAPGEPYRVLHTFTGVTTDGQWLSYSPSTPWQGVRFLRVETIESPSWVAWREIRIQLVPAS